MKNNQQILCNVVFFFLSQIKKKTGETFKPHDQKAMYAIDESGGVI